MMGYTFKRLGDLSYHHLIVPKRLGGKETIDNGACLVQKTSHDYLHLIERYDPEIFKAITNRLIDENTLRKIEYYNLKQIHDILSYFEKNYCGCRTKKGQPIIKQEYVNQRILKKHL